MGDNGNEKLESHGCKKLGTRCCPSRVHSVVSHLDDELKQLVREMGYGSLLGMKKCSLRRDIIAWLLERFNPDDGSLDLFGKIIKLDSTIFGNIIGIWDGGEDMVGSHVEDIGNGCGGERISLNELQVKLESGQERELFPRNFVMFVVGSLLMPTTSLFVVRSSEECLVSLNDVSSIRSKNWASMSFKYLVDSICRFKERKSEFVCGCLYFLQMYYFHNIEGYIRYVDRGICPTNWWSESECKLLCSWIRSVGGLEYVKVKSHYPELDNGKKFDCEEWKVTNDVLSNLSKQVVELKSMIITMQQQVKDQISSESERVACDMMSCIKRCLSSDMGMRGQNVGAVEPGLLDDVGENMVLAQDENFNLEGFGREMAIELSGSTEIIVVPTQADEDDEFINHTSDSERSKGDERNLRRMYDAYIESKGHNVGPFYLKNPMSSNEFKLAMYIFDLTLPISEVLIRVGTSEVCRYYFRSLLPQAYVDAQIVEAFSWMMSYEEKGKYRVSMRCNRILPPFIKNKNKFFERSSSTNQERVLPLKSCIKVIVPILDQDDFHWFMGELVIRDKMCVIWDSLYSGGTNTHRYSVMKDLLHFLDNTLHSEIKSLFSKDWSFSGFTIRYQQGVPRQENSYDCGVYLLKYMKLAILGTNYSDMINPHVERLLMALEIVRSPFNNVSTRVEDSASRYFLDYWSETRYEKIVPHLSGSIHNPRNLGTGGGLTTKKEWRKYWSRLGVKRKNIDL